MHPNISVLFSCFLLNGIHYSACPFTQSKKLLAFCVLDWFTFCCCCCSVMVTWPPVLAIFYLTLCWFLAVMSLCLEYITTAVVCSCSVPAPCKSGFVSCVWTMFCLSFCICHPPAMRWIKAPRQHVTNADYEILISAFRIAGWLGSQKILAREIQRFW